MTSVWIWALGVCTQEHPCLATECNGTAQCFFPDCDSSGSPLTRTQKIKFSSNLLTVLPLCWWTMMMENLFVVDVSQGEGPLGVVSQRYGTFQCDKKTSILFLVFHWPVLVTFSLWVRVMWYFIQYVLYDFRCTIQWVPHVWDHY